MAPRSATNTGEQIPDSGREMTLRRPDTDHWVAPAAPPRDHPHLLMVTTTSSTASAFLLPYAAHYRDAGWRVDLATSLLQPDLCDQFDHIYDICWTRSLRDVRRLFAAAATLRVILLKNRYDIVHTHTPIASFITRGVVGTLRPHQRPAVVYTAHGFHFHAHGSRLTNGAFAGAERVAGRWSDRLIVINHQDYEQAAARRIMSRDQIHHFPGIGLDLSWYRSTPELLQRTEDVRRTLKLADEDVLFTMVAEFTPNKNHLLALMALAQNRNPHYHVAFVGDGTMRRQMEHEAERLGVDDRTHFLGECSDVRPWILAAAATLLLSSREGLPRAVLESLALGVPVIGTRIRGIADLVASDGGLLVEPGDIGGISKALDALATGGGSALAPTVPPRLQRHSIGRLLDLHDALYDELLMSRRGHAHCP